MEDGADCLDSFGIDELLDFSHDNEFDFSYDDSSMQALSAASSDLAEEFIAVKNSNSGSLSSLMDSRSFCPPELGWFDFDNAKVLLGSSARKEENNGMQSQQEEEQLYMMSPISVLESCATSERPAMVSISSVHAGDVKNVFPSTTKRGRPITSTVRTSYSASSDEEVEDEEEEEDDDDGDVELDEDEEEDDDDEEEEEEEEEEEGSDEQSEIHGSDCALSTESEVVTEEDDGFRPPPAKRQCYEHLHHHHHQQRRQQQQQRQKQHQSYQQAQQNCQEISLRKCSHCQSQKTPQWRAGPLGPKTLCNACGVRFKSGRLLPEYRPAGSPSFVSDKHSNSHRKVLEMRRQREMEVMKKLKAEADGDITEETAML